MYIANGSGLTSSLLDARFHAGPAHRPGDSLTDPTQPAHVSRVEPILRSAVEAAVLLCGIVICLSTLVLVVRCWVPIPFADQWNELATGRSGFWSWLPTQHNEHRILVPRLVFEIEAALDHETNIAGLAVNVLVQAMLATALVRAATAGYGRDLRAMLVPTGVALATSFSMLQYENFIWAFQVQFFGVVLEALILFSVVGMGGSSWTRLLAAIVLMAGTTYTLSSGLIACGIAVAVAVCTRKSVFFSGGLLAAAGVLAVLYMHGYETPAHHSDPAGIVQHLDLVADYTTVYVGNPFGAAIDRLTGKHGIAIARGAGLIGLGLTLLHLWVFFRSDRSPSKAALVALTVFVTAMAVITAAGRVRFGPSQALSSRYESPTLAMWAALSALTYNFIRMHVTRRMRGVEFVLPVLLVGVALAAQRPFAREAERMADGEWAAMPAVAAGVADPQTVAAIFPDPVEPLRRRAILKIHNASLFSADWTQWLGTPIIQHARTTSAGACHGSIETATRVPGPLFGGWHVEGAVADAGGAANLGLVLTSPDGNVVGYGRTEHAVSGIIRAPHGLRRWMGAYVGGEPSEIKAYALLDATDICPIDNAAKTIRVDPVLSFAPLPEEHLASEGYLDAVRFGTDGMLQGWALADGLARGLRLYADTNIPFRVDSISSQSRPDVVEALNEDALRESGFLAAITVSAGAMPASPHLCIWSDDPRFGRRLLGGGGRLCPEAEK